MDGEETRDGSMSVITSVRRNQWTRFVHIHYVVNIGMLLGYGVLRQFVSSPRLTTKETWTGLSQEIEVLGLAAATLVSKYHKIATIDELLDRLFFLGKAAIAVLLYFIGVRHFLSYIILGAAAWLLVPSPRFDFPPEVEVLTPEEFRATVRSASTQAPTKRVAWIVMFHADWCSASTNLQPMFGALAKRFGDKNRRFAVVDVVAYPEVAEDLNINTGGTSKQLPTLALFTKGREVCRLPTFASDGRVVRARMDQSGVTKYFELDTEFKLASYGRKSKSRVNT